MSSARGVGPVSGDNRHDVGAETHFCNKNAMLNNGSLNMACSFAVKFDLIEQKRITSTVPDAARKSNVFITADVSVKNVRANISCDVMEKDMG